MDFRVNGLMLFQKKSCLPETCQMARPPTPEQTTLKWSSIVLTLKNRGLSIESAKIQIKNSEKTEIKLIISGSPTSNALKRLISVWIQRYKKNS